MAKAKVILYSAAVLMACWGISLRPAIAQSFAGKADYATGTDLDSVAVGDFNNDGKPDLAVANYGSTSVSVLLNFGNPVYLPFILKQ